LLAAAGDHAAVWDEAFYPVATGRWTSGAAARGAVVLGSLTKLFACPGLRVGYVLAPDARFADAVRARQPKWALNGLAAAVVPDLVAGADLAAWRDRVAELRAELAALLRSCGLAPDAADAPWVLVPDAGDLRDRLAASGVLVRDCASFGLAGTVRIAVPDERGLERLASALGARGTAARA
jgi:histidinol-phosphate/aromatic aminotransferase/cobyric acid decarboxylase-like protein